MEYRRLKEKDIQPGLFAHFQRRQVVTDCWRKLQGEWVIKSNPFVDDWDAREYEKLVADLIETVRRGGTVFGAFSDEALKGFVAIKAALLGKRNEYLDLASIHVSRDMRGQGIGRVLFGKAKEWAKSHGAKKLYISAHSSVESQAFYRAMGCVEAMEYSAEHVHNEPYDCQLECSL